MNENYFLINPSIAGIKNTHKIRLIHRQQWPGIKNAPNIQIISYDAQVLDKTGLGLLLFNDKNGNHGKIGFQATMAYHLKFSKFRSTRSRLSFAISLTNAFFSLDKSKFNSNDPALKNNNKNKYNVNLSISYLFRNAFSSVTIGNLLFTENEPKNDGIPYLVTLGYTFSINNNLILEPMILLKNDDNNSIDISTKTYYGAFKDIEIFGGFSLSQSLETLSPIAIFTNIGFTKGSFSFGYGYDLNLTQIQGYSGGSHTFMIGYEFGVTKARTKCGCSIYYGDL